MPNVVLPNLQTFSEFAPSSTGEVSHGDCGWLALLGAFHVYDRIRYPLTGDALAALRHDAIARGLADPSGATNIPDLDAWLHEHNVAHRTYCTYAGPLAGVPAFSGGYDFATLHALIKGYGDGSLRSPVIVETSTAGAGLPEDEAGVQFHYFTLGGMATPDTGLRAGDGAMGGYWRCDGDAIHTNPATSPGPPILTSALEIANTHPVGYLIIDGLPAAGGGDAVTWTLQVDGTARDSAGHLAGTGLAHALVGNKAPDATRSETPYNAAGDVFLTLTDGEVYTWTKAEGARTDRGGRVIAAQLGLLAQAQAMITALKAQLAAQPAPAMTFDEALAIVGTALKRAIGESAA